MNHLAQPRHKWQHWSQNPSKNFNPLSPLHWKFLAMPLSGVSKDWRYRGHAPLNFTKTKKNDAKTSAHYAYSKLYSKSWNPLIFFFFWRRHYDLPISWRCANPVRCLSQLNKWTYWIVFCAVVSVLNVEQRSWISFRVLLGYFGC